MHNWSFASASGGRRAACTQQRKKSAKKKQFHPVITSFSSLLKCLKREILHEMIGHEMK